MNCLHGVKVVMDRVGSVCGSACATALAAGIILLRIHVAGQCGSVHADWCGRPAGRVQERGRTEAEISYTLSRH